MKIAGASWRTVRITRISKRLDKRKRGKGGGFTLLELLMVVMVLGIVSAIAVPFFATTLERLAVDESTAQVTGALRFARNQAVLSGRPWRVVFDVGQGLAAVEMWRAADTSAIRAAGSTLDATAVEVAGAFAAAPHPVDRAPFVVDFADRPGRGTVLAGADFGGAPQVTFNTRGVPDAAGAVSVRAGAAIRTIGVTATGNIIED